jgi:tetratricopeptide (TPR) repeat protein
MNSGSLTISLQILRFMRLTTLSAALLSAVLLISGCNRDPKKFIAKGDQSFAEGKFPDAMIFYGRALQVDPRMAEAHYKLAQTHLKMKSWSSAYVELRRVVELQPDNWQAQLDLGRLELAGGHKKEANDRAQLILKANPANVEAQLLLADSDSALGKAANAIDEANQAIKMAPDRAMSYA